MDRDEMEAEANYFAMCLQMPSGLVEKWMKDNSTVSLDFCNDQAMKLIAKAFGVSQTLAAARLSDLGYL